ncbi:MAG: alpha/beta hydrolase [Pseudomonadota bacterium]
MPDDLPSLASVPTAPIVFFEGPHGRLAYRLRQPASLREGAPTLVWLAGFKSDMEGGKAVHLDGVSDAAGARYLRFDYSGHGQSAGRFEDGTIGAWTADARALIEAVTSGPLVLVGSSMGGWIALLLALALKERVAGLTLIAPAPDFTETRIWNHLDAAARNALENEGVFHAPSDYSDEPYVITRRLIEDGRKHLLLQRPISIPAPVRILQGMLDTDVEWRQALLIAERLTGEDVTVTLLKSGDHRLSTPDNLALLGETVTSLLG